MTGEILMAHKNLEDFKEAVTEHYNNIEFPAGAIGELSETIVNMSAKITLEVLQQYHKEFIEKSN